LGFRIVNDRLVSVSRARSAGVEDPAGVILGSFYSDSSGYLFDNRILFEVSSAESELWETNGYPEGTRRLWATDVAGAIYPLGLRDLALIDGIIYGDADASGRPRVIAPVPTQPLNRWWSIERAPDGQHVVVCDDDAVWSTDGTVAGTQILLDGDGICTTSPNLKTLLGTAGNHVLFAHQTESTGLDLWATDGTPEGTMALELVPGEASSDPRFLAPLVDGRALLTSDHPRLGREIWITDGTASGSFLLADVDPGGGSSYTHSGVDHPAGVLFRANDGVFFGVWEIDQDWVASIVEPPAPALVGTKEAHLISDDTIEYRVALWNEGDLALADDPGPEFLDALDPRLELLGFAATAGAVRETQEGLRWDLSLPPGASAELVFQARASSPGTYSNQATMSFDSNQDGLHDTVLLTDDPNAGGNSDPTVIAIGGSIPTADSWGLALLVVSLAALGAGLLSRG
jgi:ELWxxDGT repeat protein